MKPLLTLACVTLSLSAAAVDQKRHSSVQYAGLPSTNYELSLYKTGRHKSHNKLFKCRNAWGDRLKGKFVRTEKRLIELGGGSCHKIKRGHKNNYYGDLSAIKASGFSVRKVRSAIDEVKQTYHLYGAKVVAATNVKLKGNKIKYTLTIKEGRYKKRRFVIKQKRGNGKVTMIREIWS